ncbi:HAD family hydrolase [Allostreptomyces psammosilenae]|uniref:HAD family hydrolase n=1 Tax=Allostreptomyces psammosilenae TaxID=1892865 RepID=A0A852ZWE9_9ACTN|nr:HAD family hydrolase [Allostreptomyces psammosilenae]NYI06723.1 hypothetical protein [Allostreptomyces psammosilenae]
MTVLVASDLDRTLIYSPAALELAPPDAAAPRLLCVEVYEGKPLSFLTERAAHLLARLAEAAVFVPVTTRTEEQYRRIHLPGAAEVAPFAVTTNGGRLLVDGVVDEDWSQLVRKRLVEGCAPLAEIVDHLAEAAHPEWTLKHRVAEELFAYLVVRRDLLPAGWVAELTGWAAERGWRVSLQGRKVYLVPGPLTKRAALEEVAVRSGATRTLAAGDSLLDAELLSAADLAWMPGHGELADAGWTAAGVVPLTERGAAAGEEILRRMCAEAGAVVD